MARSLVVPAGNRRKPSITLPLVHSLLPVLDISVFVGFAGYSTAGRRGESARTDVVVERHR